jgi:hypothetical protein
MLSSALDVYSQVKLIVGPHELMEPLGEEFGFPGLGTGASCIYSMFGNQLE